MQTEDFTSKQEHGRYSHLATNKKQQQGLAKEANIYTGQGDYKWTTLWGVETRDRKYREPGERQDQDRSVPDQTPGKQTEYEGRENQGLN